MLHWLISQKNHKRLKVVIIGYRKAKRGERMNPFAPLLQYKWQSLIVLLLCLIFTEVVALHRQQLANQEVLRQIINQTTQNSNLKHQVDEISELLKSIQTAQLEQKALLTKLAPSRNTKLNVPPSKMKNFKSGNYRLSSGRTW